MDNTEDNNTTTQEPETPVGDHRCIFIPPQLLAAVAGSSIQQENLASAPDAVFQLQITNSTSVVNCLVSCFKSPVTN